MALHVLLLAPAWRAEAQDALVLVAQHADADELERIAPLVRAELGFGVRVSDRPARGETVVRFTVRGSAAELDLTRPDGVRVERSIELPENPEARTHALVALTCNLALDQTSDLLASLRAATAQHAPDAAALEAPQSVEAPAEVDRGSLEEGPWRHRHARIGLGGHVGTAPQIDGGLVPWAIVGLDAVWAPVPEIALGLRDVAFFHDESDWVVHGALAVEAALRIVEQLALHAIVGVELQSIFDGGSPDAAAGVAPRVSLGGRLFLVPELSVAADATLRVVATDEFRTIMTPFPAEAVLLSFSTSLAVHL